MRDRELSDAQLSGWNRLVHQRGRGAHEVVQLPAAGATATDGDNGGWFRNINQKANFWSYSTDPLDRSAPATPLRPIFIDEYLDRFGAHGRVACAAAPGTPTASRLEFPPVDGLADPARRHGPGPRAQRPLPRPSMARGDARRRRRADADPRSGPLASAPRGTSSNLYSGEAWVGRRSRTWTPSHGTSASTGADRPAANCAIPGRRRECHMESYCLRPAPSRPSSRTELAMHARRRRIGAAARRAHRQHAAELPHRLDPAHDRGSRPASSPPRGSPAWPRRIHQAYLSGALRRGSTSSPSHHRRTQRRRHCHLRRRDHRPASSAPMIIDTFGWLDVDAVATRSLASRRRRRSSRRRRS